MDSIRIYAAVIEWPGDLGEPPVLILDRNRDNLVPRLIEKVQEMCAALAADSDIMREFREAFAADPANLIDLTFDYDGPVITFDEQEV